MTKPRPQEIAWWFKNHSRLGTPKDLPVIQSIQKFEDEWIDWWGINQPMWREANRWPFLMDDSYTEDWRSWGDLVEGGKYGLFLVVLSLGWWIDV